jgi:hypothetical protein
MEKEILLPPVPASLVAANGSPAFGSYEGGLDAVDLSELRGPFALPLPFRLLKHKRWQYVMVATPEVLAVFSVADLTYTANAFVCAVDLEEKRVLFDGSYMGLPGPFTTVGNRPGQGARARFRTFNARFSFLRGAEAERYQIQIAASKSALAPADLEWEGEIIAAGSAPALTVIAPVPGDGVINVTQKWGGLLTSGGLHAGGKRFPLAAGVAGLDYTQGYLARRTAWRWAFANGRLANGTSLGLNLVEGFNDSSDQANENALWFGRRLIPLPRAHFEFDPSDPLRQWKVTTVDGSVDLTFTPIYAHREERDYRIVRSHLVQPLGWFDGTLRVNGEALQIARLPGVTEDQDILW